MKNLIIITGASSGIGREFALQMDDYFSNIDEFWLVARRREELDKLAKCLVHKTRILVMDITKDAQLDRLEDTLMDHHGIVRMLVNCAGFGLLGDFTSQDRAKALGMIRTNCLALTELTHRMIPYMRPGSRILQMASSAAFLPQPGFAVYAATKAYVLSFSRALGQELEKAGIYVTSVCPGPVDTPFFEIAEQTGASLAVKKYAMVSPDKVVALALKDSYYKRPVSVCGLPMKIFRMIAKLWPCSVLLRMLDLIKQVESERTERKRKERKGKETERIR